VEPRHVLDVLAQGQVVVEDWVVGQVRRRGPGIDVTDLEPRHLEGPLRRFEEPGRHAQQGGLA